MIHHPVVHGLFLMLIMFAVFLVCGGFEACADVPLVQMMCKFVSDSGSRRPSHRIRKKRSYDDDERFAASWQKNRHSSDQPYELGKLDDEETEQFLDPDRPYGTF